MKVEIKPTQDSEKLAENLEKRVESAETNEGKIDVEVAEEKETEDETDDVSPEVGTIDFGEKDSSTEKNEETTNLRDEVSNLDSVNETRTSSTRSTDKTTSKTDRARSGTSESADIKAIKKQNQKIIEKLDKVLSKL